MSYGTVEKPLLRAWIAIDKNQVWLIVYDILGPLFFDSFKCEGTPRVQLTKFRLSSPLWTHAVAVSQASKQA